MECKLTAEEKERYLRQIMLDGVGEEGQKKLLDSKVLVVGLGGLGSPVSYYLAAAGVGQIGLVDSDLVDISNLQRQILYFTPDLGRVKVESARDKLLALNPKINIKTYGVRAIRENAAQLIAEYDLVIMAVDNFSTRYLLNEVCFKQQKPLIEGAVGDFYGYVTSFIPPTGPCYQCLFPKRDGFKLKRTESSGVLGALPGVIGTIQAGEAIKIILGIGEPLLGRLLMFDFLKSEMNMVHYVRFQHCSVCS